MTFNHSKTGVVHVTELKNEKLTYSGMPKSKLLRILDDRLWFSLKLFGFRTFGLSNLISLNVRILSVLTKLDHIRYKKLYIKWSSLALEISNRTIKCLKFEHLKSEHEKVQISAFHCTVDVRIPDVRFGKPDTIVSGFQRDR